MIKVTQTSSATANAEEPWLFSLPEAAGKANLSVSSLRRRIKDGLIPSVRVGGRRFVKASALRNFVEAL